MQFLRLTRADITNWNVENFISRVLHSMKVRRNPQDVRTLIMRIFSYIDYFNSLDENTDRCLDMRLEDIDVIQELKDFITPRSVRYIAGDRRTENLLEINDVNELYFYRPNWEDSDIRDMATVGSDVELLGCRPELNSIFTINEWLDIQSEFRGLFKLGIKTETVSLKSLKQDVSLNDVLNKAAVEFRGEYRCQYTGTPFVPIRIRGVVELFRTSYFNSNEDEVIGDYFDLFKF